MMERLFKLIVHVPVAEADTMRMAIGEAGGGVIGNYSHCSFSIRGIGRFRPMMGANPHIGAVGMAEEVEEERIDVSNIGERVLEQIIAAVRAAHPYDEPLIEVIELFRI